MGQKNIMRELVVSSLIFFMLFAGCKKYETLPRDVLLVINGEPVYVEELESEIAQTYPWKDADNSSRLSFLWDPSRKKIRERLIEHLIERKLLLQEAKKSGIKVSPAEVRIQFAKIRGGVGDREFSKLFARYGIDPAKWRKKVEDDLLIKKLLEEKVYNNIVVTDKEIRKYYARHMTEFSQRKWVRVHMIVFDSLTDAQNFKKKIKTIDDFLKMGAEKNPYSPHEGYIFFRGELSDEIWKILSSLPLKRISRIYNLRSGYYIFLVMDRGTGYPGGKDALMEKIKNILKVEKRKEAYQQFLADLKKKAKIKINPLYR